MSKANDATGWYGNVFKGWQTKALGRKPTAGELATIHGLGARPGKQALANAMMLRESGVTGAQIVLAAGAPQLNKMRDFISKGLVKRVPISNSAEGHTVYKLTLTAKGEAKVKAAEAAPAEKPAKAAKVKAARKPRPAKVTAPVTEAPQGETPAQAADMAPAGIEA